MPLHLKVKTLTGVTFRLIFSNGKASMLDMKRQLPFAIEGQIVVFKGAAVPNFQTLEQAGIKDGDFCVIFNDKKKYRAAMAHKTRERERHLRRRTGMGGGLRQKLARSGGAAPSPEGRSSLEARLLQRHREALSKNVSGLDRELREAVKEVNEAREGTFKREPGFDEFRDSFGREKKKARMAYHRDKTGKYSLIPIHHSPASSSTSPPLPSIANLYTVSSALKLPSVEESSASIPVPKMRAAARSDRRRGRSTRESTARGGKAAAGARDSISRRTRAAGQSGISAIDAARGFGGLRMSQLAAQERRFMDKCGYDESSESETDLFLDFLARRTHSSQQPPNRDDPLCRSMSMPLPTMTSAASSPFTAPSNQAEFHRLMGTVRDRAANGVSRDSSDADNAGDQESVELDNAASKAAAERAGHGGDAAGAAGSGGSGDSGGDGGDEHDVGGAGSDGARNELGPIGEGQDVLLVREGSGGGVFAQRDQRDQDHPENDDDDDDEEPCPVDIDDGPEDAHGHGHEQGQRLAPVEEMDMETVHRTGGLFGDVVDVLYGEVEHSEEGEEEVAGGDGSVTQQDMLAAIRRARCQLAEADSIAHSSNSMFMHPTGPKPTQANPDSLAQLEAMGFNKSSCQRALLNHRNDVQLSLEWLLAHS